MFRGLLLNELFFLRLLLEDGSIDTLAWRASKHTKFSREAAAGKGSVLSYRAVCECSFALILLYYSNF